MGKKVDLLCLLLYPHSITTDTPRDSEFPGPDQRTTTNLATAAVYLGKYFEPFKQFPLTNMRKLPIGGFTNKLQRKIFVKNGQAKAKSMEYMFKLFQPKCMKYLYKLFLCTSLNISAI